MDKILMIAKLLPVLIEIIKTVEAAIPGEGKGEAKLVMVRQILEVTDNSIAQLWPALEKVIAILVQAFNTFKTW